jgi:hypothetical protein
LELSGSAVALIYPRCLVPIRLSRDLVLLFGGKRPVVIADGPCVNDAAVAWPHAVVAGSITTGTGSGGDGICSVSKALLMEPRPVCAVCAEPALFNHLVGAQVRRACVCGREQNACSTIAFAVTTWAFRMGIGYQVALTILVPTVVLLAGFVGLFFMLRL